MMGYDSQLSIHRPFLVAVDVLMACRIAKTKGFCMLIKKRPSERCFFGGKLLPVEIDRVEIYLVASQLYKISRYLLFFTLYSIYHQLSKKIHTSKSIPLIII